MTSNTNGFTQSWRIPQGSVRLNVHTTRELGPDDLEQIAKVVKRVTRMVDELTESLSDDE